MRRQAQAGLIAALLAAGSCAASAETATLRFGQIPSTVRGTSSVYLHIADSKGFFAREEIKLERISIPGGTGNMVAALERGEVDVTQTATPYLIQAVLRGSDAVGIASETANPIYSLIVKPEIASYADLKGKLIGLSLPVDTISISMRKLLALHGLGATDYRVKELVGTPVRFDCLKAGECDTVPLSQPEDLIATARATAGSAFRPKRCQPSNSSFWRSNARGARRTRTWWCASCGPWLRRSGISAIRRTATR